MSNELTAKDQNRELVAADPQEWGGEVFVGSNDVVIPKILPMQGLSDMVVEEKAKIGEFRDSLSGDLLGSIADPMVIVPFYVQKAWDILEEDDEGDFKWTETIPLIENPLEAGYNDNLPWEDTVNGIKIKRVRRMNFFVLVPKEMEKGNSIPYILSFKSTSLREGKKLFTQMYVRNAKARKAPCAYAFVLGGTKQKNEKGTFVVPTVTLGRESTPQEMAEALEWFKTIKKGKVKVDDSDLTGKQTEMDLDAMDVTVEASGTGKF